MSLPKTVKDTTRLSRALRYRVRKQGTITIDDATELLEKLTGKTDLHTIRQVLRKPTYRPVGYKKTAKPSRHGRPVRSWSLTK